MRLRIGVLTVVAFFPLYARADSCEIEKWTTMPLAIHQLPGTAIHEGSHWLTHKFFGNSSSINLLPACIYNGTTGRREAAWGFVLPEDEPSRLESALSAIAPYAVKIATDRILERGYKGGKIAGGSFADQYIQFTLAISLLEPLSAISEGGDLSAFSKKTKIPKIVTFAVVQLAYAESFRRVMKARGRGDGYLFFYVRW